MNVRDSRASSRKPYKMFADMLGGYRMGSKVDFGLASAYGNVLPLHLSEKPECNETQQASSLTLKPLGTLTLLKTAVLKKSCRKQSYRLENRSTKLEFFRSLRPSSLFPPPRWGRGEDADFLNFKGGGEEE